ncbi:formate/nitrite transporter family protein [Ferrimonas balearica]|uniref:formate/nitrite transporter family protein n=1 Tax=Ferrimonas balearica TaxID=44012 RepID=UPI001C990E02|nr:formate/nitrite transporter family protein [Ferrimonas balearica]MBY5920891.1 formate/nitrite transporter family protein [Ferrimonas balearica]MBY5996424.1 formate/nitrite transporter family protein [Ferrimonas balearica]
MLSGQSRFTASLCRKACLTMLAVGICACLYIASNGEMEHQAFSLQRLGILGVGLMCVALMRGGEITTSTVHAGMTLNWRALGRVLIGNLVGIALVLLVATLLGAAMWQQGQWGLSALNIALVKIHYGYWELVALGVLSNMGLCLAIWLSRVAEGTVLKLMTLFAPIWLFLNTGIEHVMINLILIPMGFVVLHFAPEAFWSVTQSDPGLYTDLTLTNLVFDNLLPVLLGNLVGGWGMIGLVHLWLDRDEQDPLLLDELDGEK